LKKVDEDKPLATINDVDIEDVEEIDPDAASVSSALQARRARRSEASKNKPKVVAKSKVVKKPAKTTKANPVASSDDEEEKPTESRAEMLARLKREAEERTAAKEAKQRTLVSIEIKPWTTEQDLMELWKKITTTVTQPGLKWGEGCTLAEVAYGIKKIQTTFVMGVNNSSDDVVEAIQNMEDDVQSVEVTSMNVL